MKKTLTTAVAAAVVALFATTAVHAEEAVCPVTGKTASGETVKKDDAKKAEGKKGEAKKDGCCGR